MSEVVSFLITALPITIILSINGLIGMFKMFKTMEVDSEIICFSVVISAVVPTVLMVIGLVSLI